MTAQNDSLELVDRLVAEYADRLAHDLDPRRDELLAQAPQFRTELERCFRMLEAGEHAAAGSLESGYELGDFVLGRVLGRGGMAVVYEAEEKSLKRQVALKVLRHHLTLDTKHLGRFQREARTAAKLRHENVVPIHAVGEADGHAFIAFELVQGPTLARVIEQLAALPARPTPADLARVCGMASLAQLPSYSAACVRLLTGVFDAVQFAHERGVIHRDLKPSNVLLTSAGKPLVADFGLAKDMGDVSLSLTGETIGTPHYMSPEQANALSNRVDARSDVYSLAVTLYELLTLKRPFEGKTLQALVHEIVTSTPTSPCTLAPDVPETLGDVVLKAMSKDQARRYASIADFRLDLERALRGEDVLAESTAGVVAFLGAWFDAEARGHPYEYRSPVTLFGLPWIHVVRGIRDPITRQPKWARGVIAVGDYAVGVYAAGKCAAGLFALGFISVGPVAVGMCAAGSVAIGGLAIGWHAQGLAAIGNTGRGITTEWVTHPLAAPFLNGSQDLATWAGPLPGLLTSLAGIVFSITMVHGLWARAWPSNAERRFIRTVTRFVMPPAFLLPLALEVIGIHLSFMGDVLLVMAILIAFSSFVKHRLGKPVGFG